MLNNVPTQINRSSRLVTLRHPNSMDCTIYRTVVKRTDTGTMGGMPTLGGLGVLDSEDEADYEYQEVGDAKIVFTGQFQTQGNNWSETDDYLIGSEMPLEALIECVLEPSDPAFFIPANRDMVMVMPGAGIVIPYEIMGESGNVNIPPYTKKYALSPRADSDVGV